MLSARNINALVSGMAPGHEIEMGTLCRPLSLSDQNDPDSVKVVRRTDGRALYFSRAPIPFPRVTGCAADLIRRHLGIYAFTREGLRRFVELEPSPLERTECLEQLRALENGMDILVLDAPDEAIGVDSPEDLQRVEQLMRRRSALGS